MSHRLRIAGLLLLAVAEVPIAIQAVGGFGGGAPTLVAPCPMSLALPALFGGPIWLVSLAPMFLFLVLCYRQFSGAPTPSISALIFFCISSLASIIYFAAGYRLGLKYEGARYTSILLLVTAICFGITGYLYISAMKPPVPISLRQPPGAKLLSRAGRFTG